MNSEEFDKEVVETSQPGEIAISLVNVSDVWLEQANLDSLRDEILLVRDEIVDNKRAVACTLTRLIIITSDYNSEVAKWQHILGYPVLTSTDDNAIAVGKTLSWGDGKPETTYPIIILNEAIAIGLISDDQPQQMFSKGILAHEFGHAHDDFVRLNVYGETPPPMNDDWGKIRQYVAEAVWSEFFAESVAYPYIKEIGITENLELAIELAKNCHSKLNAEIDRYTLSRDMGELWNCACSEISKACNQFGRVAGLLSQHDNKSDLNEFRDKLGIFSNEWKDIFDQMYGALNAIDKIEKWPERDFVNLQALIEKAFHINGIYPDQQEHGLWVNIR